MVGESLGLVLLLEEGDGDLDDGLFGLLVDFGHAFAEVVLQVHRILLGVDVDLALLVEGLQCELSHPLPRLLFDGRAVSGHGDEFALLLEVLGEGEVVLEAKALDFLGFVAAVGVQAERELKLLIHLLLYITYNTDPHAITTTNRLYE